MRIRGIVDLSVPVGPETQVLPGDPVPRPQVHSTIARHGFNLLRLDVGSQNGTHVDAPYRFADDGAKVAEPDLRLFTGPGVVVDVRGVAPRSRIGWDLELGVRTFCIDAVSVGETRDEDHPGAGYPVHHLIARAGGVTGENLRNLERIDLADPLVSCPPIALEDADGAPVRVVAMEVEA